MSYMMFIKFKAETKRFVNERLFLKEVDAMNKIYLLGDGQTSHSYIKPDFKNNRVYLRKEIIDFLKQLCKEGLYFSFVINYAKGSVKEAYNFNEKEKISIEDLNENKAFEENIRYIINC